MKTLQQLAKPLVTRKWILTTVLVVAASFAMLRLGIWQLNRLEQRRILNSRILAQIDAPVLELDVEVVEQGIDLCAMEYRQVRVTGVYIFDQQTSWRNQVKDDKLGVSLLTPLLVDGTDTAVLVNRGWIPAEDADRVAWTRYDQGGEVTVQGVVRCSQTDIVFNMKPDTTPAPGEGVRNAWSYVNISEIRKVVDVPLLSVYVHQYPAEGQPPLPASSELDIEITEGPHLNYAIQWFGFSAVLFFGYPFYVRKQLEKAEQDN